MMSPKEQREVIIYDAMMALQCHSERLSKLVNTHGSAEDRKAYRDGVYAACVKLQVALGTETMERLHHAAQAREVAMRHDMEHHQGKPPGGWRDWGISLCVWHSMDEKPEPLRAILVDVGWASGPTIMLGRLNRHRIPVAVGCTLPPIAWAYMPERSALVSGTVDADTRTHQETSRGRPSTLVTCSCGTRVSLTAARKAGWKVSIGNGDHRGICVGCLRDQIQRERFGVSHEPKTP